MSWLKKRPEITEIGEEPLRPSLDLVTREIPLASVGSDVTVEIEAEPVEPESEEPGSPFRARVGVLNEDIIVLIETKGSRVDSGSEVTLRWCAESGERTVNALVESANEWTWTVRATSSVIHRQRRAWVRVGTTVPIRVRALGTEASYRGSTINLSCGGVAAAIEVPDDGVPPEGEKLDIEIQLPTGRVVASGTVLQTWGSDRRYTLRVAFGEMNDGYREQIARHVFQVHREDLARRREALDR